jgi:hypothetical protein
MIPPGKTTLTRMQLAAQLEAERIEIIEDGWVTLGQLPVPRADRVRLRDDFAGIVRLIDIINSDQTILERLEAARRREARPLPAEAPSIEEDASE